MEGQEGPPTENFLRQEGASKGNGSWERWSHTHSKEDPPPTIRGLVQEVNQSFPGLRKVTFILKQTFKGNGEVNQSFPGP